MTREDLILCFEIDQWAMDRWHAAAPGLPFPSELERVVRHIAVGCHAGWYRSAAGLELELPDDVWEAHRLANQAWRALLADRDPDEAIRHTRRNGEVVTLTLGEIAFHVANHAVYHRGELRGLCRAQGVEDFPDTDACFFFMERRG